MDATKVYIACAEELNNDEVYAKLYSFMPKYRRKKADRFVNREDKNLCVASFALLKEALENEGISDFEVLINENGKPYLKDRDDVFFNISHSGSVVMCAVSKREVGCDVQKIKKVDLSVFERFLSREEREYIKSQKEKNDAFIRLWTLKESFAKMTGEGLKLGFDKFTIDISGENIKRPDENVCFKEFNEINGYKCSVCYKTRDIQIIDITKKDC